MELGNISRCARVPTIDLCTCAMYVLLSKITIYLTKCDHMSPKTSIISILTLAEIEQTAIWIYREEKIKKNCWKLFLIKDDALCAIFPPRLCDY